MERRRASVSSCVMVRMAHTTWMAGMGWVARHCPLAYASKSVQGLAAPSMFSVGTPRNWASVVGGSARPAISRYEGMRNFPAPRANRVNQEPGGDTRDRAAPLQGTHSPLEAFP